MRLYLEELGLTYKSKMISFERQDLKAPEMLALNPRGLVPIFMDQHRKIIMYESLAIVQYLEAMYAPQGKTLLPDSITDTARYSQCLIRLHEVNNAAAYTGELVFYLGRTAQEAVTCRKKRTR